MRIVRREEEWRHLRDAIGLALLEESCRLTRVAVVADHGAIPAAGIDPVLIERVRGDVAKLEATDRGDVLRRDLAIVTATGYRLGAAILLRGVGAVRKCAVGSYVIELPGRLVVPGAPCAAPIHAENGALIDAEEEAARVLWIDPEDMEVVAGGRSNVCRKGAATVERTVERRLRHVEDVGILRIDEDAAEVCAAEYPR